MSRYFVGFLLPRQAQDLLVSFQHSISDTLPQRYPYQVSWTEPADLHCTLLYLGRVDDVDALCAQLEELATTLEQVDVHLGGTTHWLGRNSLAVGITGAQSLAEPIITDLRMLSSDRWAGRRPFHGHVTVGRVRPVPEAGIDHFTDHRLEPFSWQIDSIQLLRSRNNIALPRYETVKTFKLYEDNSGI